ATQPGGMDLPAGRQVGASKCEVIFERALRLLKENLSVSFDILGRYELYGQIEGLKDWMKSHQPACRRGRFLNSSIIFLNSGSSGLGIATDGDFRAY
ncbi:MAG: hypothetical protein JW883_06895, partial [Deltaproteobacteria bacterium]|nr:hypothetical protein [Deltaproteobacteria bacterium]